MKKNRKKTDTYRFNGNPFLNKFSIHSVTIEKLELLIKRYESKLADPNDPDDKKWITRWLERLLKECEKKNKGKAFKEKERQARRMTNALNHVFPLTSADSSGYVYSVVDNNQ